jgi:hypothetical protein
LQVITQQIRQALQNRIERVQAEVNVQVNAVDSTQQQRREIKQKALTLIERGFTQSLIQLRNWLIPSNLLARYETDAIAALQRSEFATWETDRLKQDWLIQKRLVTDWIYKACDFLELPRPTDLWISFPDPPTLPTLPNSSNNPGFSDSSPGSPDSDQSNGVTPVAIATGLGWVLGGPLGAAVLGGASYVLNQITDRSPEAVKEASHHSVDDSAYDSIYNLEDYSAELNQIHSAAIQDYFDRLSANALAALSQYEITAQKILSLEVEETPVSSVNPAQQHQLALLQTTLDLLHDET